MIDTKDLWRYIMLKYKVILKYLKEKNFLGFNNHQILEEKFYADF